MMMEGTEFQLRTSGSIVNPPSYPLTLDQRITQGDRYREAAEELEASLQSIEDFYSSPQAAGHTGSPDCTRCSTKKKRITQAYYDYYLGNQPGRWDEWLVEYRQEIQDMFNTPDIPLYAIHDRFKAELLCHLKRDLCVILPSDSKEIIECKTRTKSTFEEGLPLKDILEYFLYSKKMHLTRVDPQPDRFPSHFQHTQPANTFYPPEDILNFQFDIENANSTAHRAQLYVSYYCTQAWNDSPQQRNFKLKYAKLFESGVSHDTVLGIWRKEAIDIKKREREKLKHRLGELRMAQSAHLKNKAKKREKDARVKDKEYVNAPNLVWCSLRGCERNMDVTKERALECAVCDWLAGKGQGRRHFFYCSKEHVEEDFDEHDRTEHACIMGEQCIYAPPSGPPAQTGDCGICPACVDNEIVSFFCSQECHTHNIHAHRVMFHYERGIEYHTNTLDMFRPEPDLEIANS